MHRCTDDLHIYIYTGSQKTVLNLVVSERTKHTPPRLINSTLGF